MTDNARLELNDEHTALLHKYTAQQLRFIINRLVFPEASSMTSAITSRGCLYGKPSLLDK